MSRASVNSDSQIPVLTINQSHLFVHSPYGMVSHIQDYVQYKNVLQFGHLRVAKFSVYVYDYG